MSNDFRETARVSPYAPGDVAVSTYECGPCLPTTYGSAPPIVLAANPYPTATAPDGSGVTIQMVDIAANPKTGLQTDILIEIAVAKDAVTGDYPISLELWGTDAVTHQYRTLIIPVRTGI